MFLFDDRTDKMLDISADWSAATGESDCSVTAHLRAGQIAAVTVEDDSNISMCRSAAAAILGDDILRSIEASQSLARSD
ncbi:hypothetical protein [Paracoccus beibuensis]|uniref:hypothetical protein n=1 Tax=Paracoccus beibuensis TaxID=547602 RepID=UPI00223EE8D4|nr:hypothetical protein [Paracoccus beibuensis]